MNATTTETKAKKEHDRYHSGNTAGCAWCIEDDRARQEHERRWATEPAYRNQCRREASRLNRIPIPPGVLELE